MKIEKFGKILSNLHDKTEYVIQIRNLKQALNRGLILRKVVRVTKFNQSAWLYPFIDTNIDLGKNQKNMILKKIFLS